LRNLYLRTLLVYSIVLIVFLLSLVVSPYFFVIFIIGSTIIKKGKAIVTITKDELSFKYLIYNFTLMVLTVFTLFFIVTRCFSV